MNNLIDRLLQSLDVDANLLPFLQFSGWIQSEPENKNWIVMYGPVDLQGKPLELVFPKDRREEGVRREYAIKAVELITAIRNEPIQLVIQNIIYFDRDMLYVRNTDNGEENAIEFNLAVDQILNLKRTILYSASSEKDPKPFFENPTTIANKMIKQFLFGHTFAGSFGFTVEAPRLPDPRQFMQYRLPFNEDNSPPPINIPFERRIMERIARGLNLTKIAEKQKNPKPLLDEYSSGFNSNMCSAVVGMSKQKRATVEFRIAWSPKLKPGEDLADPDPIRITNTGYEMLDYVATQLKTRDPEFVTVVGHVRALTSTDNPFIIGARRAVVIRGMIPERKKATDIIVELEREDYASANKAHINWQNVKISGILSRSGSDWRLLNIRNFKVLE